MRETHTGVAGDSGVAAVEFAIIVPLLLLLVFGIIEFGTLFAQQLALSNGARQGARFAAVPDSTDITAPTSSCAQITQQVQDAASTIGMNGASVAVTITGGVHPCASSTDTATYPCQGSGGSGVPVTVQAAYVSTPIVPFPYPGAISLAATGQYECENF